MSMSIPIDVFLSYRKQYIEPLDEIKQFIGAGWRKESNWVTTSKYTRNPWIKTERSIKTILNKISNSNFEDMQHEISEIIFKNKQEMKETVDIIINKAVGEKQFCKIYGKLCNRIAGLQVIENNTSILLIQILLAQCQAQFSGYMTNNSDKHRIVGFMTFLGELYISDVLSINIVRACLLTMFTKINDITYMADGISALYNTIKTKLSTTHVSDNEIFRNKIQEILTMDIPIRSRCVLEIL